MEERLRTRLTPLGVQLRQAQAPDAPGRMNHASQVDLIREFALTAASMSTMTSRLLAAELIEKPVDERELCSDVFTFSKQGKAS